MNPTTARWRMIRQDSALVPAIRSRGTEEFPSQMSLAVFHESYELRPWAAALLSHFASADRQIPAKYRHETLENVTRRSTGLRFFATCKELYAEGGGSRNVEGNEPIERAAWEFGANKFRFILGKMA